MLHTQWCSSLSLFTKRHQWLPHSSKAHFSSEYCSSLQRRIKGKKSKYRMQHTRLANLSSWVSPGKILAHSAMWRNNQLHTERSSIHLVSGRRVLVEPQHFLQSRTISPRILERIRNCSSQGPLSKARTSSNLIHKRSTSGIRHKLPAECRGLMSLHRTS